MDVSRPTVTRTAVVVVRVTPRELDRWRSAAASADMRISEAIREAMRGWVERQTALRAVAAESDGGGPRAA
jgi:hypothetical protein